MKEVIVIIGTGKMAYNIGMYLLKLNYSIHWYSKTEKYLLLLKKKVRNELKKITRYDPEQKDSQFEYDFHDTTSKIENESNIKIIIDCTTESVIKKQHVITSFSSLLKKYNPLLISTSSSILPSYIHSDCIGCHFFYPVELTQMVEIIHSDSKSLKHVEYLQSWITKIGFTFINQNEKNAFAINRLLLPIEAESFRYLINGFDPELIDRATCSSILHNGQLSFIDMVGIELIYKSNKNYIEQLQSKIQRDYFPFIEALKKLLTMGKLGKKNKNGILIGEPLPWKRNSSNNINPKSLSTHFFYLFLNTCMKFLKEEQITLSQLKLAFSSIYHSDFSYKEIKKHYSDSHFNLYLNDLFIKTHLSYFKNM